MVPVIIVGGSLVGLSAALNLSKYKIPTIVLERHASISKHPRAIGFTSRTMEIYNPLGIVDQIPQVPADFKLMRARVESLAGNWYESTSWTDTAKDQDQQKQQEEVPKKQYSPYRGAAMPQDQLESILETAARKGGADIRRQQTVVGVEQDQDGVTVTVADANGETSQFHGSYLIAADGNRSGIREQLEISRQGRGHMQTMRSVLFRASLAEYLNGVHQFNIDQPDLKAFLTTYNDGRWALMFYDDIERDETTLLSCIHQAIGRSDLPVEIITTGRWELAALVADIFQRGRIFLAGDAAHTLPPNRGGYGANTGIADAHNLAWKLASVLSGQSRPELLDTYDAERRPVALLRHDQIFARSDYKIHLDTKTSPGEVLDDDAMEFGQIYFSGGFVGVDDTLLPVAKKPDEWAGQPGTRMAHFEVIQGDGEKVSILDSVGDRWTLLSGSEEWGEIVDGVNERSAVKVHHIRIGDAQAERGVFQEALGVKETGAALIRPDGYVAWRSSELSDVNILEDVLKKVAFTA